MENELKNYYKKLIEQFLVTVRANSIEQLLSLFKKYYPLAISNLNNNDNDFNVILKEYIDKDLEKSNASDFLSICKSTDKYNSILLTEMLQRYKEELYPQYLPIVKKFCQIYPSGKRTYETFKKYLNTVEAKNLIVNDFYEEMSQIYDPFIDINKPEFRKRICKSICTKLLNDFPLDTFIDVNDKDPRGKLSDINNGNLVNAILHTNYHNMLESQRKIPLLAYTKEGLEFITKIRERFFKFSLNDQYASVKIAKEWGL